MIQIRDRHLPDARLAALVSEVVALVQGSSSRVVVNDRLDVALACGAAGVHLRADSPPAARVRPFVPAGFLIGRSVHGTEDAVKAAAEADYLIAGTVWASESKPGRASLLGIGGLAEIARAVRVPVLAIGGVDIEHVGAVSAAGARGLAAIGLFLGPSRGSAAPCRAVALTGIVQDVRARFDTSRYH